MLGIKHTTDRVIAVVETMTLYVVSLYHYTVVDYKKFRCFFFFSLPAVWCVYLRGDALQCTFVNDQNETIAYNV